MLKDPLREKLKDLMEKGILERGLMILDDQLDDIKQLFEHRCIPEHGWTARQINFLLTLLSSMDTDKDEAAARVGEREGRTASEYVLSLAAGFAHGVGRSGDISAVQPKAAGGSLLHILANRVATSLIKGIGLPAVDTSMVLPLASGMSIALCLAAIHRAWMEQTPGDPWQRTEVIYPRVDHKSPLKGIELAGFRPVVVEGHLDGDAVIVPVEAVKNSITSKTAAILSTTAFFPPRSTDDIKGIAKLAKDAGIPHVVNNSYGLQSDAYLKLLRGAMEAGRIDYIVQSTDKNFLTPVGGAVICSQFKDRIESVGRSYAGRATAQPIVQFLAAALTYGLAGYKKLMVEQKEHRATLQKHAENFAGRTGQRVLRVDNPVATAVTLEGLPRDIGGKLYTLRVTGPRAVFPGEFGSCIDTYPVAYMTLNAGIGAKREDLDRVGEKMEKLASQLKL
nr:O-phosphoseryl-tRNA(Sec) selenium transferase [Candidatus Sigynarchaeum springense]MDO8116365.1 O-phosphoseryl-tRNA(Sec) selenium transferase [Candidatus Sigynarchaeota archaeon]